MFHESEARSLWASQRQMRHLVLICNYSFPPGLINIISKTLLHSSGKCNSELVITETKKKEINKQMVL